LGQVPLSTGIFAPLCGSRIFGLKKIKKIFGVDKAPIFEVEESVETWEKVSEGILDIGFPSPPPTFHSLRSKPFWSRIKLVILGHETP
jgi:hypothetical protein